VVGFEVEGGRALGIEIYVHVWRCGEEDLEGEE